MTPANLILQPIRPLPRVAHPGRCLRLAAILICLCSTIAMACPPWVSAIHSGGSGSNTGAISIQVAPGGDYFVTGQFSATATFSGTNLVSAGAGDIFLAKYAPSGKLLWIIQAGGSGDDAAMSLALDKADDVYLTGAFTDSATFFSHNNANKTVSGVGQTMFLAKYNTNGNLLWVQTGVVASSGWLNEGYGVAVDQLRHMVYVTGPTQGNVVFSSENGTSHTVAGTGSWHMVVAKYDWAGNFQWAETNQASPNSLPRGIAVDASGNAYVTGWIEDEATFSSANGKDITITGFSPAQINIDYPDDAFLAAYDKNGNLKWVNHIGGYKAVGNAVAVSPAGQISLVGFIGNIDYGSASEASTIVTSQSPGKNINLGGGHFTEPYTADGFVVTYDNNGVLLRALRFDSSINKAANALAYDSLGLMYVTGAYMGSSTNQGLFVRKYAGTKLQWERTAQSAGMWHPEGEFPAVSVSSSGGIFVTGEFSGTAVFGSLSLTAAGPSDMFVAELAY